MEKFLLVLIEILAAIGIANMIFQVYRVLVAIVGVFKYRKFKKTDYLHQYGICIAARNEETVIENLLDSIYNQDYPIDKLKIFVCADNCTDSTVDIVRDYQKKHNYKNLFLFEHKNINERTKGFALRYLFSQIIEKFGFDCVDGYFVFDADNVLKRDYISRMNEAFDEGNKIVTSCRMSKNIDRNPLAFSYAVHWMKTCLFENKGKVFFNLPCRVQGTGFLFDKELVKNGWRYTSLTEDRSFCTDAVVKGYTISYCHDALFYDEQPADFKVAFRQRIRWAKGHLQSAVENCPKLIRNMCKFDKGFFISYDCYWLNFPNTIEELIRNVALYICRISLVLFSTMRFQEFFGSTIFGISFDKIFVSPILGFLFVLLIEYFINWLKYCAIAIIVLVSFRKRIRGLATWKKIVGVMLFFIFARIGFYSYCIALCTKVEWKEIPHVAVKNPDEL